MWESQSPTDGKSGTCNRSKGGSLNQWEKNEEQTKTATDVHYKSTKMIQKNFQRKMMSKIYNKNVK